MKLIIMTLGVGLLSACAGNDALRDQREYQEAEWRAQLVEDRNRCRSSGGYLVIKTGMARLGRRTTLQPGDTYSCDKSLAYQRR